MSMYNLFATFSNIFLHIEFVEAGSEKGVLRHICKKDTNM